MLTHMPAVISYPIDLNGQGHCQGHLVSLDSIAKLTEHKSRKLKCSLDAAKRRFYRAANIVYLIRLDELHLKKSFYKLFQANVCQS